MYGPNQVRAGENQSTDGAPKNRHIIRRIFIFVYYTTQEKTRVHNFSLSPPPPTLFLNPCSYSAMWMKGGFNHRQTLRASPLTTPILLVTHTVTAASEKQLDI